MCSLWLYDDGLGVQRFTIISYCYPNGTCDSAENCLKLCDSIVFEKCEIN